MKEKICSIKGCGKKHQARGYCQYHYQHMKHIGLLKAIRIYRTNCSVEGCNKKHYAQGYCSTHYAQLLRGKTPKIIQYRSCLFNGCSRNTTSGDYCGYHRAMLANRKGTNIKGENNPRWNGGTSEYKNHYVMKKIRIDKLKSINYICEICGGDANEVHHKDGDKTNHSLDNFVALCHQCHMKQHSGRKNQHTNTFYQKQLMQIEKRKNDLLSQYSDLLVQIQEKMKEVAA